MPIELKRVNVKKQYGEWKSRKVFDADLDAPIWELYKVVDGKPEFEYCFGFYDDMISYIENGVLI